MSVKMTKTERVEKTLNFQPIDRAAIHDNIAGGAQEIMKYYTGNVDNSAENVCEVVRKTMDIWRPPVSLYVTDCANEGFIYQSAQGQEWTSWIIKRPFTDNKSLKEYLHKEIDKINNKIVKLDKDQERKKYRERLFFYKNLLNDDTVMMNTIHAPIREYLWRVGMDLFVYFYNDEPQIVKTCLQKYLEYQLNIIDIVADKILSPAVLIATEICSTKGPLFNMDFLRDNLFPAVKCLANAWHQHGVKVLIEMQGNSQALIDSFLKCKVDGFYAIEPVANMDIVELKKKYPKVVWACGIDGINLMGSDNQEEVRKEVRRQIVETNCLNAGGLFIGTSSELNPNIRPENYQSMIEEVALNCNPNI